MFIKIVDKFYAYQQMKPSGLSNFLIFYTFRQILVIVDLPANLWIKLMTLNYF